MGALLDKLLIFTVSHRKEKSQPVGAIFHIRDVSFSPTRQDKLLRELIPHIGPLPFAIPLKLFLERNGFPADNISLRITWKFCGGVKVQKHVGSGELWRMRKKRTQIIFQIGAYRPNVCDEIFN